MFHARYNGVKGGGGCGRVRCRARRSRRAPSCPHLGGARLHLAALGAKRAATGDRARPAEALAHDSAGARSTQSGAKPARADGGTSPKTLGDAPALSHRLPAAEPGWTPRRPGASRPRAPPRLRGRGDGPAGMRQRNSPALRRGRREGQSIGFNQGGRAYSRRGRRTRANWSRRLEAPHITDELSQAHHFVPDAPVVCAPHGCWHDKPDAGMPHLSVLRWRDAFLQGQQVLRPDPVGFT